MAQQNAEHYLRSLLLGLGFTNVIFLDPYTPTPVPSGTPVPTLTVTPATP
jgi:hypothetical protein